MSGWLAYGLGVATPFAVSAVVIGFVLACDRSGYECLDCGWSTGIVGALRAWAGWRWHRHVTRRIGRCPR